MPAAPGDSSAPDLHDFFLNAPRQNACERSFYPIRDRIYYSRAYDRVAPYLPQLLADPSMEYALYDDIPLGAWTDAITPDESLSAYGHYASNLQPLHRGKLKTAMPALLPAVEPKIDHLCLLHPAQALQFLHRGGITDRFAAGVRKTIRLAAWLPTVPVVPLWGRHFSPLLQSTVPYRLLGLGQTGRLTLWNSTLETIAQLTVSGILYQPGIWAPNAPLHIRWLGKHRELTGTHWSLTFDLPSGFTDIYFTVAHEAGMQPHDLQFYDVTITGKAVSLAGEAALAQDNHNMALIADEAQLRNRIHAAGFMDVECRYYLQQLPQGTTGITRLNVQTLTGEALQPLTLPPASPQLLRPVMAIGYRDCAAPYLEEEAA